MDVRPGSRVLSHHLVLVVVGAVVFFTNLGVPRLWDRDEPRNAGCALEMLDRNDWVVPTFNADLRVHKPVLLYWFMMTAYGVFGATEFAARFWSAALGIGTVLLTYHIGRRLFDEGVGLWGALVLATTLMFAVAARAATPDSALIFFTTLAMGVYVFATFPRRHNSPLPHAGEGSSQTTPELVHCWYPRRWSTVALMYAVMGVAVLAKGPVGLVLPTATIGMFLLIMRLPRGDAGASDARRPGWLAYPFALLRPFAPLHFLRTCWFMRPITALSAALAVALPWYVWVGVRTHGAWLEGFFLEHNVHRAMHSMEGHNGPIIYYVVALCIGFFPWSVLFAPTLMEVGRRVRAGHAWKPGLILMACWAGVYLGLFSLAQTKLPSYITPAYPAVALLTACFLDRYRREVGVAPSWLLKVALGILVLVGAGLLIGLPLAARRYLPGEEWLAVIALVPLAGGIAALVLEARSKTRHVVTAFSVTSVLFVTALIGVAPVWVDRHRTTDVLLDAITTRSDNPDIATFGCLEPSWVFYARRPITELGRQDPSAAGAFLDSGADAFLITTDRHYERLRGVLPDDAHVVATTQAFLDDEQLLVVAHGPRRRIAKRAPGRSASR